MSGSWVYRAWFVLFLIIWVVPLHYLVFIGGDIPWVGRSLNHQYRVSRLFAKRTDSWSDYYVEYRSVAAESWIGIDLDEFSNMYLYGHRTRLQRVLVDSLRDPEGGAAIRRKLGHFVKTKLEGDHGVSEVRELRFVRVRYPVGIPEMAKPGGKWSSPPFENTRQEFRSVVSHLQFPVRSR